MTLLGRNGMGKTTTVALPSWACTAPTAGTITLAGQRIERLPSYRIAQAGLGLVPEGRQVFPNLTVRENLVATASRRNAGPSPGRSSACYELFPRLQERSGRLGGQLSGGEQQMLAIGRALMTNPRLLILDEATEGLAPLIRAEIWRSLEQLKAEGLSILVIDKNVQGADAARRPPLHPREGPRRLERHLGRAVADANVQHRYLGV